VRQQRGPSAACFVPAQLLTRDRISDGMLCYKLMGDQSQASFAKGWGISCACLLARVIALRCSRRLRCRACAALLPACLCCIADGSLMHRRHGCCYRVEGRACPGMTPIACVY
jgi:hypothetical protein